MGSRGGVGQGVGVEVVGVKGWGWWSRVVVGGQGVWMVGLLPHSSETQKSMEMCPVSAPIKIFSF